MAESAARRDRVDSQAVPGWYLWEAAQKPVSVYLSFDLIDRLEHETVENFRSLTSRGSEMGGILLGTAAPGDPAAVSVADYETIECDYTRGPLFRLSDADLGRFERALEERSGEGKIQVVGFFRSHTRKGLALDADDLQLLEARFRSPHAIALLVRPFATRVSIGGIFLREEGGFNSEASPLEFPFRSAQLTPSKRTPETAAQVAPATRAQVVPIATRREVSAPAPTIAVIAPPPPVAQAPAAVVMVEPIPATPAENAAGTTGAPAVEAETEHATAPAVPPSPEKTAVPASETASILFGGLPAPLFGGISASNSTLAEAGAPIESKRASKVPMLTGLLAAALLGFVLLFVYPGFLYHWQHSTPGASQDSSPLTLRIEHTGTDVLLTWNREATAIRSASRATLSISDGDRHENYDMDLAQLRTGSIVYSPLGGDVSFQMEVIGQNGSHTATETLRMLRTRPSPMPEEGQQAKSGKPGDVTSLAPQTSAPAAGAPDSTVADVPAVAEAKRAGGAVKPFDASSLAQRLRPAQPAELADTAGPATGAPISPKVGDESSLPFAMTSAPAPAGPSTAAPAASPISRPADTKSSTPGGQVQQAQLIFRKEPAYPAMAWQMGVKGLVELIATVGTDGSVKAVKVVKGHPLLIKAAEEAVMQWRYRPTILNGVPIQNETRVTLNFVRDR